MAGLLDLAQHDQQQGLQGLAQASQLEQRRDDNNKAMKAQHEANQKSAVGSAIGTGVSVGLAAGPVAGVAAGGAMLLASLL